MRDRLAPWKEEEIAGMRQEIKRIVVKEGAIKSKELLERLKIELDISDR